MTQYVHESSIEFKRDLIRKWSNTDDLQEIIDIVKDYVINHTHIVDKKQYDLIQHQLNYPNDCILTNMRITHHAVGSHADFIDVSILAKNVTTLDQFIKNMMSEGKKIAKKIFDTEEDQERYYNQFVGDLFEVFVEFFIKSHGRDRRIGISNYNPVHVENGEEDLGVDGHGIGTNGRPATVQVKFRAQHDYMLTTNADSLSNFKNASHEMFNVNFDDIDNMLVVTTAKSVHHKSRDRMLNGKVRFLFRHDIEKLVNNNIAFWNAFHAAIMPPVSIKQQVKQLEAV